MKVILKSDIKGIGKKDQLINASDGYARNFLLPKGLAVEANKENMSKLNGKLESAKYQKNMLKEQAITTKETLSKILLKIYVKSGENGKIFGGVSNKDIADTLKKEHKIIVNKKKIDLKETIKTLGVHNVNIKLFEGVIANLKIDVLSK